MCGIAGFIDGSRTLPEGQRWAIAERVRTALRHRGPDDEGTWLDAETFTTLVQTRLAIVDLSPLGHQPMSTPDGRFTLVYNGELYNHQELRDDLTAHGIPFRGRSDTETLLQSLATWGVPGTLTRAEGMFAFGLHDRESRTLTLARDRLGIKPLFYGRRGDVTAFASELKALRPLPGYASDVDRNALAVFLQHGYVPTPCCIERDVFKLPPGTTLTIRLDDPTRLPDPQPYWSLAEVVREAKANPFEGDFEAATEQVGHAIERSITQRLMADVPLGTFLSGGIDSSLVTALTREQLTTPLHAFTIGFSEAEYDESRHAIAIVEALRRRSGAEIVHHVRTVTPEDALALIPDLPTLYDEPFADSSQIPTHLVSRLARESVTVCLSGDGGDELFGGYHRYTHIDGIRRKIQRVPYVLRAPLAKLYETVINRGLKRRTDQGFLTQLATVRGTQELYTELHRHWRQRRSLVVGGEASAAAFDPSRLWIDTGDPIESMMAFDTLTYLPDDILTKVDRASMACGLEARVPLLDHRLVELAFRLPMSIKRRAGIGKAPLRSLLGRHIPKETFERKKMGFGVPIDHWLRGPLREWASDLLDETRLKREGFLDPQPIRKRLHEHLNGEWDWQYPLWNVLMFQSWLASQ